MRLYERLFTVADPDDDTDGKTYRDHLNPDSRRVVRGFVEPSLADARPGTALQFERLGYFVADSRDALRRAVDDWNNASPRFGKEIDLNGTGLKRLPAPEVPQGLK